MKVLITGGSGFIGTNAVEYFYKKGFDVLNIDIKKPQNNNHIKFWSECDILDLDNYHQQVLKYNPDYFLHLAARTDLNETKSISGYDTNITGVENTVKVVNSCTNIKRTIFASSRLVCRIGYLPKNETDYCPPNLYGESKVIGEKIVRASKMNCDWIIIRPTSIWGEWFDVPYRNFFDTVYNGTYFNPGKFNPQKSFGYVGNSVYQLDKLLHCEKDLVCGKTLYLCDYPPLRVSEWAQLIHKEFGKTKSIKTMPYPLLKIIALVGDVLYTIGWLNVPLQSFRLSNLITQMIYPTEELKQIAGDLPFSLIDGVKRTVKWYITHRFA
jgi:nucleoside-diphosphate-sugar epimerase